MTLALIVDFQIAPDHAEAFAAAIAHNAAQSVSVEPGCQQFDVCRDPADAGTFFLYELYDDQAAIAAHVASPHYLAFDAQTKPWVLSKKVRHLALTGR